MTTRLLFALLLAGLPLAAQSGGTMGTIAGTVTDASGLPVAGAHVALQHEESGAKRTTATDETGQFRFAPLPIGSYKLRVELEGFATVETESFTLSLGQTVTHRIQMKPAAVAEKVEVQERPDALEATAATAGVALGSERVEETPSQGRSYLNVVLTAPGAASSSGSNTQRSAAGSRGALNDSGFSFAGMRGRNNSLNIDGVDNRDETTGGNRVAIGMEMVQEFRVSNTLVGAENGGAAGGIVNVTTWSGTNLWHGDATFFTQNEFANAREPEAETSFTPKFRRYQPGHSLNGPIRKDRTFFAYAVEQEWESGEEWSETPKSLLGTVPGLTRGLFSTGSEQSEGSFKLTHLEGSRHSSSARYAFSRGRDSNEVLDSNNFTDRSARGSGVTRDHSFVGAWIFAVNPRAVSDLRVQVARRDVSLVPNSGIPMMEIPGVITIGQGYRMRGSRQEDHFEVVEGVTISRGKHQINFGGSVHRVHLDSSVINFAGGLYLFPTVAAFLANRPDVYIRSSGADANYSTLPVGVWINDHWEARPGVSFELGLRYDRQAMPPRLPPSSNNFAPRLGLAWRPGNAPFVLRLGAGLFYDRYPLAYLNNVAQSQAATYGGGPLTYVASSHFPSTYSRKATAGIEYSLDRDTTATLEYSYVRGFHLPRIRNIAGGLPPTWQIEQTAKSAHQGASLSLHRRLHKEVAYLIAYSVGSTHDDASDFDEQPQDPRNLAAEWARSRQHQLQRLAASATFEFFDLVISPIFTTGSGRPINALESSDFYRAGAYPLSARPPGFARNPFFSPPVRSLDLRVMKTFPVKENKRAILQVGVEGFNLTNHNNPLKVSQTYAAQGARLSSYGQTAESLNARQIQFFTQFEF